MNSIFLVGSDNSLTELNRSNYGSEELFQRLLGDHPAMLRLAGGTIGKLLLIKREQPVSDSATASGRWSLDHLFLDGEGVPVLVEVKQASDTRARREVVAQMLDYAANGVAYWPIEQLIQSYRQTAELAGRDADSQLTEFLAGADVDPFWRAVEANLRSGRIRMLFVADRIPKELARIVEFLNEQMRPAEVLAIEVENFVSTTGVRTLVPRLVGQTQRAELAKAVADPGQKLSENEWLETLEIRHGLPARQGAERVSGWFREHGFNVGLTDSQDSLYAKLVRSNGKSSWPFFLRSSTGRFEISFQNLAHLDQFKDDSSRQGLLDRLRAIPSSTFKSTDKLNGWPSFAMAELMQETLWKAIQNLAAEIRSNILADH